MDKSEFEKQLAAFSKFVERYVYRKVSNKFDGDDIIQEVYLAAYKNCGSLHDASKFKAWIMSIANNKCADHYRRVYGKNDVNIDDIKYIEDEKASYFTEADEAYVYETLDKMPENYRRLLLDFYIENKSHREIAEQLKCPLGTVKSRLYAAKNKFRDLYPNVFGKEDTYMNLPKYLPDITITRMEAEPFEVICTQDMGYFISPVLGEKCVFANYDFNSGGRLEKVSEEKAYAANKAMIHGIECVEIVFDDEKRAMSHFMRLTDTHLQMTAFMSKRRSGGIMHIHTFLDDEFFGKWGFGENNCGEEILRKPRGIIRENTHDHFVTDKVEEHNLDVCGRFRVSVGDKVYDTVRSVYFNTFGEYAENYIARDGRIVLFRRFDRIDNNNENRSKVFINGELYEHISSSIADYSIR